MYRLQKLAKKSSSKSYTTWRRCCCERLDNVESKAEAPALTFYKKSNLFNHFRAPPFSVIACHF